MFVYISIVIVYLEVLILFISVHVFYTEVNKEMVYLRYTKKDTGFYGLKRKFKV